MDLAGGSNCHKDDDNNDVNNDDGSNDGDVDDKDNATLITNR